MPSSRLASGAGEARRHVLGDQDRPGEVRRQRSQQSFQRRRAAGGGADQHEASPLAAARRLGPLRPEERLGSSRRLAAADPCGGSAPAGAGWISAVRPPRCAPSRRSRDPNRPSAATPRPSASATKSTAPSRSASSVASAPSAVSEDTITTGQGRSTMMRSRQARPSIPRHVDVERDDIGRERRQALPAPPCRCARSGPRTRLWREKTWPSSFRTSAESSTTSTLITRKPASPPGMRRAGRVRPGSTARRDRAAG